MAGPAPLPLDATLALASATRPATPGKTADAAQARKAAQEFEAVFLAQVVEEMFAGLEPDALFGGGEGEALYRSLLVREYGAALARRGGVGIGDLVQKEILKLQEAQ